ncbi:MAG: S41 family peptidase [Bacteroidales bacterium]|nr:S41 family peptidase [Bacteroidales bacterium]
MNSNNNKGFGWLITIAMAMGVVIGLMSAPHLLRTKQASSPLGDKVERVMDLVEHAYVDTLDADTLGERLIGAMLNELDPHCHYFSAPDLRREEEQIRGNFEGIGVILKYIDDSVFVYQVLPDGPSAGSALKPGDKLLRVDSTVLSGAGLSNEEVVGHIRGPRGTVASLMVQSYGQDKPHTVNVARGVVTTPSVIYSGMIDDSTAYVRVARFAEATHYEFHNALANLRLRGMKRLVIDLRGNAGGVLEAAVGMARELLPHGRMIVYTEGAHSPRSDMRSQGGGLFTKGKLAVMIDEYSASASEVLAGAVQDNDRGIIVGRRSFGKGLVQRQFELKDGSAVWLTVARYYTPSGRCIQRPYNRGTDEYYTEFLNRMFEESKTDTALATINDSTPYHTTGGRVVYGGGGIYPDHRLPYFTDNRLVYVNRLASRGVLENTAFGYVRANADALKAEYASADDFVARFNTPATLYNDLLKAGTKAGIERDEASLAKYGPYLRTMLKAYIGEALYGQGTFTRIHLETDDEITRTLNLLK